MRVCAMELLAHSNDRPPVQQKSLTSACYRKDFGGSRE
jgi:hypothetical protein